VNIGSTNSRFPYLVLGEPRAEQELILLNPPDSKPGAIRNLGSACIQALYCTVPLRTALIMPLSGQFSFELVDECFPLVQQGHRFAVLWIQNKLFYSILFYSILFYSILFSILFYSILFYSILFYFILYRKLYSM
jgi:hypothetical protein